MSEAGRVDGYKKVAMLMTREKPALPIRTKNGPGRTDEQHGAASERG